MDDLNSTIELEVAYTEGFRAGKQAAAEQIIKDICQMGGCSRGVVLNPWDIEDLKKKYGVK